MAKWASRLTLEITGVRVERLQDISEEDAKKEGIKYADGQMDKMGFIHYNSRANQFKELWNATHKKQEEKFEANPWVFVINFNK